MGNYSGLLSESTVYLSYLEMGRTKFFNLGSSPYQAGVY